MAAPEDARAARRRRALEVAGACGLAALAWFTLLPGTDRPLEWADIAMEGTWALAVGAGYVLLRRPPSSFIEHGWRLAFLSLLLEVYDELTRESVLLGEYLTGALGIAGLALLALGLQRALRHEEEETVARRRAEEREHQSRLDVERANRALRDALQARDDIVSIVAHDFRSPLTLIKGYAELLHMRAADEDTRRYLGVIGHQAQHLASLAADTLTMSRLDSGSLPLSFEPLRVAEIAERVAVARGERVRLQVAPECAGAETVGDAGRLEQVLQNLVDNALKYSPAAAPVDLRLSRQDGALHVAVRDEGSGIAPDEVALLFQKFSRLPSARRDGIAGTGLGLFICKAIVDGHGGRIWVESAPGRGSTFHVLLPVSDAHEPQRS
jgi:signal transduction histidine kinase